MRCKCEAFKPIELDRKSINARIKESRTIKSCLHALAENSELRITLFRCPECGRFWQSGHEWNFGDVEYLFQVPEVEIAEWLREPYAQPAAMMIFSTMMRDSFQRSRLEECSVPCRVEGCQFMALRLSVFCRRHHIESLQKTHRLPQKPVGRFFAPYYEEQQLDQ